MFEDIASLDQQAPIPITRIIQGDDGVEYILRLWGRLSHDDARPFPCRFSQVVRIHFVVVWERIEDMPDIESVDDSYRFGYHSCSHDE